MTYKEFFSIIKEGFIKDQNFILIEKIQRISTSAYGSYGNDLFAFCEIINYNNDKRNIIRFVGSGKIAEVPRHIKVEVISIVLESPDHLNLGGAFEAKHRVIFKGSIADEKNPEEIDIHFLLKILKNYHSLIY